MLAHPVKLLARMDPYLFEKHALTGRTAFWQLLLSEFDKPYVTQRSIKGQALVLAEHALPEIEPLITDFPDEEILFATEEEKVPKEENGFV